MRLHNLKLFLQIFFFFFCLLFFIFNGSAFGTIVHYKLKVITQAVIAEIKRPPNLSFTGQVSSSNQTPKASTPTRKNKKEEPKETLRVSSSVISLIRKYYNNQENIVILPKFEIVAPIKTVAYPNLSLIYKKLHQGVVLYPGTAEPGKGYSIIIGHSSQYPWEPGRYKSVFSLLNELKKEDKIYIIWKNKILIFKVKDKKIFLPWPKGQATTETIFPPENQPILILQSCWPVGVARKRVAVKTILISTQQFDINKFNIEKH